MGGMVSTKKHMKIFKIRTLSSADKYGVACRNLRELKEKGSKKFQLPLGSARVCLYEDGTEVNDDEYLKHLPDNTELVLLTAGQTWHGSIDWLLNSFYTSLADIPEAARRLLSDEQAPKTHKILVDFVHNLNENILAETREEDQPWFEGIESRFKNKSSFMRFRCESRIRGYMKEGAFDVADCASRHSINPYSNRESRILFSTWNLDHRIEKSRAILPCLVEAVKERNGRRLNHRYFFDLLFTRKNLKLVHIACHKKTSHSLSCDHSEIYIRHKRARSKRSRPRVS
ncbi:DNA fragmentation factor subunit beta isoform 2-T2 [Mantella aurantiaca]